MRTRVVTPGHHDHAVRLEHHAVGVKTIHHHNVVAQRSPGLTRFAAHPGEMFERERGILKGCDRTDVASPSHVVSPTCPEWMDRVRRTRVLECRILSDPVGVAGDFMWSPQGRHPRLPPWMPTLGFGVPPRCGEDCATDAEKQTPSFLR